MVPAHHVSLVNYPDVLLCGGCFLIIPIPPTHRLPGIPCGCFMSTLNNMPAAATMTGLYIYTGRGFMALLCGCGFAFHSTASLWSRDQGCALQQNWAVMLAQCSCVRGHVRMATLTRYRVNHTHFFTLLLPVQPLACEHHC